MIIFTFLNLSSRSMVRLIKVYNSKEIIGQYNELMNLIRLERKILEGEKGHYYLIVYSDGP